VIVDFSERILKDVQFNLYLFPSSAETQRLILNESKVVVCVQHGSMGLVFWKWVDPTQIVYFQTLLPIGPPWLIKGVDHILNRTVLQLEMIWYLTLVEATYFVQINCVNPILVWYFLKLRTWLYTFIKLHWNHWKFIIQRNFNIWALTILITLNFIL
jgi:hypothetical protein